MSCLSLYPWAYTGPNMQLTLKEWHDCSTLGVWFWKHPLISSALEFSFEKYKQEIYLTEQCWALNQTMYGNCLAPCWVVVSSVMLFPLFLHYSLAARDLPCRDGSVLPASHHGQRFQRTRKKSLLRADVRWKHVWVFSQALFPEQSKLVGNWLFYFLLRSGESNVRENGFLWVL